MIDFVETNGLVVPKAPEDPGLWPVFELVTGRRISVNPLEVQAISEGQEPGVTYISVKGNCNNPNEESYFPVRGTFTQVRELLARRH